MKPRASGRELDGLSETSLGDLADRMIRMIRESSHELTALNEAVDVLSQLGGRVLPKLLPLLSHPRSEVRIAGSLLLGHSGSVEAVEPLLAMLQDRDPNVVYHAIEGLGRLRVRSAAPQLLRFLNSEEFFLTFAVLESLARLEEVAVLPEVLALCDDPVLAEPALLCLGSLKSLSGLPALTQALGSRDISLPGLLSGIEMIVAAAESEGFTPESVRELFLRNLPPGGAERLGGTMSRIANPEPGSASLGLVRLLGWTSAEQADTYFPLLLENRQTRDAAADTFPLQHLSPPVLARLAEHWDPAVRSATARACRRFPGEIAELLQRLLNDRQPEVARAAASTLLTRAPVVDPRRLLPLLDHPDAILRKTLLSYLVHNVSGEDELIDRLFSSSSPEVRGAAARWLGNRNAEGDWERLRDQFEREEDEGVRADLVEALSSKEEASEWLSETLLRSWDGATESFRAAVTRILHRLPEGTASTLLQKALLSPDLWVRLYACRAASERESLQAVVDKRALAQDPLPPVRAAAASLARSDQEIEELLVPMLSDPEVDVVRSAVSALSQLGTGYAEKSLRKFFRESSEANLRRMALAGLAGSGAEETVTLAAEALDDSDLRSTAWEVLWASGTRQAARAVSRALLDPNLFPLLAVLETPAGELPALSEELREGVSVDPARLPRALEASVRWRLTDGLELVREALRHPDPWTRRQGLVALWKLNGRGALPYLRKPAEEDSDPGVRALASLFVEVLETMPT